MRGRRHDSGSIFFAMGRKHTRVKGQRNPHFGCTWRARPQSGQGTTWFVAFVEVFSCHLVDAPSSKSSLSSDGSIPKHACARTSCNRKLPRVRGVSVGQSIGSINKEDDLLKPAGQKGPLDRARRTQMERTAILGERGERSTACPPHGPFRGPSSIFQN